MLYWAIGFITIFTGVLLTTITVQARAGYERCWITGQYRPIIIIDDITPPAPRPVPTATPRPTQPTPSPTPTPRPTPQPRIAQQPFASVTSQPLPGDALGIDRSYRDSIGWHETLFTANRIFHLGDTTQPLYASRSIQDIDGNNSIMNRRSLYLIIAECDQFTRYGRINVIISSFSNPSVDSRARQSHALFTIENNNRNNSIVEEWQRVGGARTEIFQHGLHVSTADLSTFEVINRLTPELLAILPQTFQDSFSQNMDVHVQFNNEHESILIPQDYVIELNIDAEITRITGRPAQEARRLVSDMRVYINNETYRLYPHHGTFSPQLLHRYGSSYFDGSVFRGSFDGRYINWTPFPENHRLVQTWRALLSELNLGWGNERQVFERANPLPTRFVDERNRINAEIEAHRLTFPTVLNDEITWLSNEIHQLINNLTRYNEREIWLLLEPKQNRRRELLEQAQILSTQFNNQQNLLNLQLQALNERIYEYNDKRWQNHVASRN